jgi:hypothetical protein
MAEAVRTRIDIDVRGGDEVERAAASLDKLAAAEGRATDGASALTVASDKESKVIERNAVGVDKLAQRYDADYRSRQRYLKDREALTRAMNAGLGGTEAYSVALAGLTKHEAELSRVTNDNVPMGSRFGEATIAADRFANTLERVREFSWQNSTFSGDEIDRVVNPLQLLNRTLGVMPALAITAGAAMEGALTLIGARAQSALADLEEVNRKVGGLGVNQISGAQIVGASAGMTQDQTRAALENAGKEFAQYQRNAGGVKDALEAVDKDFLKIVDSARSAGEFIDAVGREIQSLPRAEALDLSKALLGDDAGARMFESVRNGALSMHSLGDEASRAGELNDELARHADEMRKQIDEAAQIANTKLLTAFQSLGSPIDDLRLSWYSVLGSIGDAITRSEELRQVMQGLLHPIDTIMGAPKVIGNLIAGQTPQDRPIGRLIDMQQRNDFDALKSQWMSAGPKIEFPTIGETRKRFEDRANAEEKEKETSRGRAHGGGRSGLSDASRAEDQYDKITRQLQGQLSLLSSQGDEHDRIKLALDIEKQQIALGSGATDMQKRGVADLVTQIDAATKAQQKFNEEAKAMQEAYGSIANSLSGSIKSIVHGGSPLDALNKSLTSMQDNLIDATLTGGGPFGKALGFAGKDGATGGAFGAIGDMLGLGGDKTTQKMEVQAGVVNVAGGIGGSVTGLLGLGSNSNFAGQAAGAVGPFEQTSSGGGIFGAIGSWLGSLGQNAAGTDNWRGGLTWVGEQGPELLNLPGGSQIMSNRDSVDLARSQARAADSHASAMAMMAGQRSAATSGVVAAPVTVNVHNAPAGTEVKETTDSRGQRRVDVVINERGAQSLTSSHGREAMRSTYGVAPKLAQR